jgi:hypothetical protein
MKEKRLKTCLGVAIALALLPASASACDFGASLPFYVTATSTNPNTTITLLDIPNTGNLYGGPGHLRGIACLFVGPPDTASPPGSLVNVYVTVNGGAQQTITLSAANFPQDHSSTKQEFSDWLPFQIIFSSIKIQLNRNNSLSGTYNSIVCQATYDLTIECE